MEMGWEDHMFDVDVMKSSEMTVAMGGMYGHVEVVDLRSKSSVHNDFYGLDHFCEVKEVSFSSDDRFLLSCFEQTTVLRDVRMWEPIFRRDGINMYGARFSLPTQPDVFVTALRDRTSVQCWSASTGQLITSLDDHAVRRSTTSLTAMVGTRNTTQLITSHHGTPRFGDYPSNHLAFWRLDHL